jgi:putative restriction endonuclease
MNFRSRDFLLRLGAINVYKRGEQRAPHKPLYLLSLLARLQQRAPRFVKFTEIRAKLNDALRLFAPRVASVNAHYPFWRLQNDKLSEVVHQGELRIRKSNDDPTVSSLIACEAMGGLTEGDFELLAGNIDLQSLVAHKILDAHFPQIIHGDIVNFFGLRLNTPHRDDYSNYSEFASSVIRAYKGRCAISGFSLSYLGKPSGLDATHICWPQIGGNDAVSNGIAMTTLHARLFHLGIFTIGPAFNIQLSKDGDLSESGPAFGLINDRLILLPSDRSEQPNSDALMWHNKSVFRG